MAAGDLVGWLLVAVFGILALCFVLMIVSDD